MKTIFTRPLLLGLIAALTSAAALADITVGVSLPVTGPGAALGIPVKNSLEFWPDKIGNEKLKIVFADDASDPSQASRNANKFVVEDNADVILGSALTPTALAVAQVAQDKGVAQLACAPIELAADKQKWVFRIPQPIALMAAAVAGDIKARKFKTVGFIGFNDPWGDVWLKSVQPDLEAAGVKLVAVERYSRADTSVTGQAIKLLAARPDAIIVAASGAGATLPQNALVDKGYKGQIYHTHGAASRDVLRVGGLTMEGTIMPVGPMLVAEQLPDGNASKKVSLDYIQQYESKYGHGTRNPFGIHANDALMILKKAVPVALKKAKPGTPEFRNALRDAIESEKEIAGGNGVYNFSPTDHFGLDQRGRLLVRVEQGEFKLLK